MKNLPLLTAASLICCTACANVTIVQNHAPKAVIVLPKNPPQMVQYAAKELQDHIRLATDATLDILSDDQQIPKDRIPIYLGDSPQTRQLGIDVNSLKPDGFTIVATQTAIGIAGRDYDGKPIVWNARHPFRSAECLNEEAKLCAFGENGTLHGVYRFLENVAGIRWYMTGDLGRIVPKRDSLLVPVQKTTVEPDFEYRFAWFCNFPTALRDAIWYKRVGFGAQYPVPINHNFVEMQYFKDTRPDFFAIIDGKPDFDNRSVICGGGNYCLSNEDLVDEWVKRISKAFDANPGIKLYPLCPGDGIVKTCECEKCQKQLSPHLGEDGSTSNYVWGFINKVAKKIAEKYPDHYIGSFAYENYRQPPEIDDFSNNVAVMICYIRQNNRDPKQQQNIDTLTAAWAKKTDRLYFWTYPIFDYWLPFRGFPCFYPKLLQREMIFHKQLNAKGEFMESEFKTTGDPDLADQHITMPGLSHINAYLRAKLLWDANLDLNQLLEEYYTLFYGPAQPQMKQFWELAETLFTRQFTSHPAEQYTASDINNLLDTLKNALAQTTENSDEYKRIKLILDEMTPFATQLLNISTSIRQFNAAWTTEDITPNTFIDTLDTPLWNKAKRAKFVNTDGSEADVSTMVYAIANPNGIAFAFVCFENQIEKLRMHTTKRDEGPVWDDDAIELFFAPNDESIGFQYIVTAGENLWDGKWTGGPRGRVQSEWNGNAFYKAKRLQDRWTLQVFIPWSDLETSPDNLKLNLYRVRSLGNSPQFTAFTPIMVPQHQAPQYFAPLNIIK